MLAKRDFHLQTGNLGYKTGLSFTNGESWVTNGILGLLFTLSIKIVNTSDGGYRTDSENELLSTKAGKGNQNGMEHGIGLKRIREIVERHFGIMEILPEKEMFSVNILIPLHQGEQQT